MLASRFIVSRPQGSKSFGGKNSITKSSPSSTIFKRNFVARETVGAVLRPSPLPHKTWLDAPNVPEQIANLPSTKISQLPNALRVATEESGGETATVGVFINAGSSSETEAENGVAHFLEHMAFKGTHTRPKKVLEEEIENLGATLNAYTSRENTVYYAKVFKNDVPKAVEILSDILSNSVISERDVESERSTILREMEEVNKEKVEVIFDYLHAAAYQGTALGRTILGPEKNIKRISRDDLSAYIKKYYTGPRMAVTAVGAVNHEAFVGIANTHFGKFPGYEKGEFPTLTDVVSPKGPTPYTGSMVTIENDFTDDLHFAIAVEGVSWRSPDYFTMLLVQTILGNWDKSIGAGKNLSSPLAEVVTRENLGSSFSTFNTCYYDTGLFGVYGVTTENNAYDMLYEVLNCWNKVGKNLTDGQLQRAKEKLKSALLMQLDGTTPICEEIGRQVLTYNKRISANEIFGRINSVTVADVRRVMGEKCEDSDPTVVCMGPLGNLPDYNSIRNWTYWNRW